MKIGKEAIMITDRDREFIGIAYAHSRSLDGVANTGVSFE
jgi:hypothetical protein